MRRILPALWLTLLSPLAMGAPNARQEFATLMTLVPDAEHGARLFNHCVACHGSDGNGVIAGTTPRIAGQHYRVLARQLVDFRHGRRWDYRMEGVTSSHRAVPELQDLADVAWFISQMDRDGIRGIGDGQYVEEGEKLYSANCAACHGVAGEGDGTRDIPRLAGQHAAYLVRQIYDAVDRRRPPLTRSHGKRFEPLIYQDVLGIADYLSRLGWDTSSIMRTNSATDSAPIFSMTRAR